MIRYVGGMVRSIALILLSLSLVACGKKNSTLSLPAPLGSMIEVTHAYPGVGMVVAPGGSGICTGTFVSDRTVLTAAHCVSAAGQYSFYTSDNTAFMTSTKLVMGNGSIDDLNDIALLVFDKPVARQDQIHHFSDTVSVGETIRLVGVGCNNLETRRGAGVKRTGTNVVAGLDQYISFLTPRNYARGILGPINRAGSCFGDSGGPAFAEVEGELLIVGVTHAGGYSGDDLVSEYVNVANRSDNRSWLRAKNAQYDLGMQGL